jgi:hypothetical protein
MKTIEINGKQYQEYDVVMLPTEIMTGIVLHGTGIDPYYDTNTNAGMFDALNAVQNIGGICQHLYFISDEKIVKEDWVYDEYNNKIYQATDVVIHNMKSLDYEPFLKKIIATTDETLSVVKERAGDNIWTRQLPQVPKQFVEHFIESYNTGNKISKVLVECIGLRCKDKTLKYFVKLNKNNEVSVLIEQSPVDAKESSVIDALKDISNHLDKMNSKFEKQETLEEAAGKYVYEHYKSYAYKDELELIFIDGARHQAERMSSTTQQLINSLKECLGWMESLRVSGDAGNWDWKDDEYTRAQELLNRTKN